MGAVFKLFPFVFVLICFASFSLMGLPFLSGYYSKEKILEFSFYIYNNNNLFVFWLGLFSAFLTSLYSLRLIFLSFFFVPNNTKKIYEKLHTNLENYLIFVLFCLGFGTIFSGYFFNDLIIGLGTDWLKFTSNQINFFNFDINLHLGKLHLNLLAFYYTLFGFYVVFCFYFFYPKEFLLFFFHKIISESFYHNDLYHKNFFMYSYLFFSKRWYINLFYNRYLAYPVLFLGYTETFLILDKGFFEGISLLTIRFIDKVSKILIKNFYMNFFFGETLFILFLLYIIFFNFINIFIYFSFLEDFNCVFFLLAVPRKKIRKKIRLKEINIKTFLKKKKCFYIKTFLEKKKN